MKPFEALKDWIQQKQSHQKLGLSLGFLVIGLLSLWLLFSLTSTKTAVLFNHLDPRDARHFIKKLEDAHISYKLANHGRSILVAKEAVYQTRIKVLGDDLSLVSNVGFELFDGSDFGMTEFSQKINYQRALQGELERSIQGLQEVKTARVHLVIPEQHLFEQPNNQPRAAVTLHLKKTLNKEQQRSIQRLVSASVPRLRPEAVVIVDQYAKGQSPSADDPNDAHFIEKKRLDRYFQNKVTKILSPIFKGALQVSVDVTLNYDALQRDLDKPETRGLLTDKENQHSNSAKAGHITEAHDFGHEKTYQAAHSKEHFIREPGSIQRLTVSVVLPKDTPLATKFQVERLVKSSIGFNSQRGDLIAVEALMIEEPPVQPLQSLPKPAARPSNMVMSNFLSLMLGSLLLLCLLWHRHHVRLQRRASLRNALHQWMAEHD